MRVIVVAGLLVGACAQGSDDPAGNAQPTNAAVEGDTGWRLAIAGEEPSLVLAADRDAPDIRIICRPAQQQLLVNVPAFDPIGSEERLSFGQGGAAVALVADVRGDSSRGGVTGEGALPENLAELLSGRVSASYGAQASGPHPALPGALANAFADACSGGSSTDSGTPATNEPIEPSPAISGACLRSQDGEPVPANAIKAVGTEPFWAANVEGRCVTYSHPENQAGTRVWTSFSGTAASGIWTGSLNGQPFVMRTSTRAGCSDGMSDKRYPIAVSLTVGGEQRTGCAEPR